MVLWLNSHTVSYCNRGLTDWLIDYILFNVPLENLSLIWESHHCRWTAAKFRTVLRTYGLWAGMALYCGNMDLGFCGFIRSTAPFSPFVRQARKPGWTVKYCSRRWTNTVIDLAHRIFIISFHETNDINIWKMHRVLSLQITLQVQSLIFPVALQLDRYRRQHYSSRNHHHWSVFIYSYLFSWIL